jgi:D-galactose 1-dehydrogenase
MSLHLAAGGATLTVDGVRVVDEAPREYPMIYERFHTLLAEGRSDVDIRPLRLVADACLLGSRTIVDPFVD